ncbi:unnamed protein product [Closterium sp. NIES-53]
MVRERKRRRKTAAEKLTATQVKREGRVGIGKNGERGSEGKGGGVKGGLADGALEESNSKPAMWSAWLRAAL